MDIREYWSSISAKQKREFAIKAGTSQLYIQSHLVTTPPNRVPRPKLYRQLIAASNNKITQKAQFKYFYGI